jgi:hypothetical protein
MNADLHASGAGKDLPAGLAGHGPQIRVERKNFSFDLRENPRGKFLRITEEVNGRYDTIIVPIAGLEQFRNALDEVIRASRHSR